MKTRARRAEGGWRLTGTKMWITNSPIADVFVVGAKDDEGGRIRGFVLEKGMDGLVGAEDRGQVQPARLGHRGRSLMDDVFCPEANAVPGGPRAEGAVRLPSTTRATASPGGRWGRRSSAGTRRATTRWSAPMFGRPLAATHWCRRSWRTCRPRSRWGWRGRLRPPPPPPLGRMKDAGRCPPGGDQPDEAQTTAARRWRSPACRAIYTAATASPTSTHVIRHVMNLEAVNTYEGTHDIHALILGRAQTGIQAFG